MRIASAFAACALFFGFAAVDISPAHAQSAGSWSYAYTGGQAVATERDSQGEITGMISCRPPSGELQIAAFPLSRAGGGTKNVTISIGDFTMEARGRVDRIDRDLGGGRAFIVSLEQSPPVIAGGRSGAPVTLSVGGRSYTFSRGAGQRLSDVALACWSAA